MTQQNNEVRFALEESELMNSTTYIIVVECTMAIEGLTTSLKKELHNQSNKTSNNTPKVLQVLPKSLIEITS